MTKADVINAVHTETGISKVMIGKVLDSFGVLASETLGKGEDIPLPGLGSLKVVQRAAREGRNPRTGETVKIPAKKAAKFAASKALKEALR